jgi:hypothetical protein
MPKQRCQTNDKANKTSPNHGQCQHQETAIDGFGAIDSVDAIDSAKAVSILKTVEAIDSIKDVNAVKANKAIKPVKASKAGKSIETIKTVIACHATVLINSLNESHTSVTNVSIKHFLLLVERQPTVTL